MQIKKYILLLASVLFVVACSNDDFTHQEPIQDGPVKVGFWMGRGDSENTRTFINDDGQTISWEAEDKVALWAQKDGAYTFQNQTFDTWFVAAETNQAFFTTTLPEAMPEGTYTYYACYPKPQSVSGTTATFTLPSMQDGKMGGGADIMVAQGTGPALEKLYTPADPNNSEVVPDYIIEDGLTLNMHHLIHALRFYVPAGKWGFPTGETVERIVFTMPANVAGTVTADVSNTNGLTLTSGGTNTISLNLKESIKASTADSGGNITYDYAVAAILPGTYSGNMTVKVYSQTKASQVTIPINNRTMAANHITPVGLNCSEIVDLYSLRFVYAGNNLGEDVTEVRVKYTDENGTSQTLTIPGSQFIKDGYYDVDLTDWDYSFSALRSVLKNQVITVEYESEHAIVSEQVTLPDVTQKGVSIVNLVVPYLFFEDFSKINGYNIYGGNVSDKRKAPSTINDTFYYSGWTGSQTSGKKGTAIRIRTRNETTWAFYNGRVDSAPISGLKDGAKVNVVVSFDYNAVAEESGDDCMSFSYGYTTTQGPIEAYWWYRPLFGSQTGGYHIENAVTLPLPSASNMASFSDDVYPSSYHTIDDFKISSCTNKHRLSWEPLASGANNHLANSKNHWLYIDNIKVQIVSE